MTKNKRIKAELILASQNAITKDILYTFKLTFPRIILSEVNTHKIASKNTSSSRAIPVPEMMKRVWNDPFIPYRWGTYQKGMQAGPQLTGFKRWLAIQVWRTGRLFDLAEAWIDHYILHLAKEITNRVYERFVWTEQLFSTTDVENLLQLRDHFAAEPHFQECAHQIHQIVDSVKAHFGEGASRVYYSGRCQVLFPGQWHLPYVPAWRDLVYTLESSFHSSSCNTRLSEANPCTCPISIEYWKKVSAGRCAWVSYFMPGDDSQKMDNESAAINTCYKLVGSQPLHASPLEHQATPIPSQFRCGNFLSFLQFRKTIPGESGGDLVVPSITPAEAEHMIIKWEESHGDIRTNR